MRSNSTKWPKELREADEQRRPVMLTEVGWGSKPVSISVQVSVKVDPGRLVVELAPTDCPSNLVEE